MTEVRLKEKTIQKISVMMQPRTEIGNDEKTVYNISEHFLTFI
jgi:hypothetical protein